MCRVEDKGKRDCSGKQTKESKWAQEEEPGFQANTDVVTQKGWCKIEEEYFHTLNELFFPQLNSERRVQSNLIQGRQRATYLFR